MRLTCFIVIFLVLVQTGTGQSLTELGLRGIEPINQEILNLSDLSFLEITDSANDPILLGSRTKDLGESLFVGKGIKGVYLEISIPIIPANAVVAEVRFPEMKSDSLHQVGHLYGSQGSIKPFVTAFRSGPFNSLLNAIRGKNTINYWLPGFKSNICNPFGDF